MWASKEHKKWPHALSSLVLIAVIDTTCSAHAQTSCMSLPFKPEYGSYNITPPASGPPFSDGTKVFYTCNYGYWLRARMNPGWFMNPITCRQDGTWSPAPTCKLVDCQKPMISKGSGVTVVGTNYTFGSEIRYECNPGFSTLEPIAWCMADGSWSNKYNPWCTARRCAQIVSWDMNWTLIPYGFVNVTQKGISDKMDPQMENSHYKAELKYTCTNNTRPLNGTTNVTCNGVGRWSPAPPVCAVQGHQCSVTPTGASSCPDKYSSPLATACCTRGENERTGERCCLPRSRQMYNIRFSGLTGECAVSMHDRFSICSTQITDCLDKQPNSCIYEIMPNYLYGCNAPAGAPPSPVYTLNDTGLEPFCATYYGSDVVPCMEMEQSILDNSVSPGRSVCLPTSCANDSTMVAELANSTLSLKCALLIKAQGRGYCEKKSLTIQCKNGLSGTAEQKFNRSCAQCPQPGGDPSLTSCCKLENETFGCCRPKAAIMFDDRLFGVENAVCRGALTESMQSCGPAVAQCLSTYAAGTRKWNNCPSFWGCASSVPDSSTCARYWPDTNNSVWCESWCDGGDKGGPWTCPYEYFCLHGACRNMTDLYQLAEANARLVCDYWKLTSGESSCRSFNSRLQCHVDGQTVTASYYMKGTRNRLSTGGIVGIVLGVIVFFAILAFAIGWFAKHRTQRKSALYKPVLMSAEMINIKRSDMKANHYA